MVANTWGPCRSAFWSSAVSTGNPPERISHDARDHLSLALHELVVECEPAYITAAFGRGRAPYGALRLLGSEEHEPDEVEVAPHDRFQPVIRLPNRQCPY